jgi:hypothetical protein
MGDQDIARDMKHWPFRVSEKHGKPSITVKHIGDDRDFVSFAHHNIAIMKLTFFFLVP